MCVYVHECGSCDGDLAPREAYTHAPLCRFICMYVNMFVTPGSWDGNLAHTDLPYDVCMYVCMYMHVCMEESCVGVCDL